MNLELRDQVAVVAAGSKGLGKAIASTLAVEGCRVAICGRNADTLEQAVVDIARDCTGQPQAPELLPVVADVAKPEDCARFVDAARERWGGVDILVTNTGGPRPGAFENMADEDWQHAIDSTLMNVVHLVRAVLPHLRARGGGSIVNVASLSAKQPIAGLLLSNAMRPAIVGLARTLANEHAKDGIRVNNVLPGMHLTDRLRELADVRAKSNGTSQTEELQRMAAMIPRGRIGEPEELANVAVFLASPRASFVTGQSIVVDGGAFPGLL